MSNVYLLQVSLGIGDFGGHEKAVLYVRPRTSPGLLNPRTDIVIRLQEGSPAPSRRSHSYLTEQRASPDE